MVKEAKSVTTVRLSKDARRLLDALTEKMGLTQAGVIELAIRRIAAAEYVALPAEKK